MDHRALYGPVRAFMGLLGPNPAPSKDSAFEPFTAVKVQLTGGEQVSEQALLCQRLVRQERVLVVERLWGGGPLTPRCRRQGFGT